MSASVLFVLSVFIRQNNGQLRAAMRRHISDNITTETCYNTIRDRKSEAGAIRLGRKKRLENPVSNRLVDALPVVFNF